MRELINVGSPRRFRLEPDQETTCCKLGAVRSRGPWLDLVMLLLKCGLSEVSAAMSPSLSNSLSLSLSLFLSLSQTCQLYFQPSMGQTMRPSAVSWVRLATGLDLITLLLKCGLSEVFKATPPSLPLHLSQLARL